MKIQIDDVAFELNKEDVASVHVADLIYEHIYPALCYALNSVEGVSRDPSLNEMGRPPKQ